MYKAYLKKLCGLLALEYNCKPEDFMSGDNVLTVSELIDGGRNYSGKKSFFSACTLGQNTVITADEVLHPKLGALMEKTKGHWLFNMPDLVKINDLLREYGYSLSATHHMLLPDKDVEPALDIPVKWFNDREIDVFYGDKRFTHAICEKYLPNRPDRIAVCAYDGDTIMGMAACSEDAPNWLQIGIDVCEEYRSRGVGAYLVTLMKNEIIRRGGIPFYGSAMSNLNSQNIARNCGFKPAWVEIYAVKNEEK